MDLGEFSKFFRDRAVTLSAFSFESFIVDVHVVVLIDEVADEFRHTHRIEGSVAEELDPVGFVYCYGCMLLGLEVTVGIIDREVFAVLFLGAVLTDQFLGFGIEEFPYLFLFGFPFRVVEIEVAFAWLLEEPSFRCLADEGGFVRVVFTGVAPLLLRIIICDLNVWHWFSL